MSVPTEVIVAIITVFGGGIISLLLKLVSVISKVNEAVNEKHKRVDKDGNIPPKLFDIVLETNKLSKETRNSLTELTTKCNRIEETINTQIFPRLGSVETKNDELAKKFMYLSKLNALQKSKLKDTQISFAEEELEGEEDG